ncbi:hypothetical protein FF100_36150 [Methylobacterium terricola]|uniref:Uncharacterized protein n=1 Tax=Methylobacterium terricola TaxID=2583531 RepID=A0A5C4L5V3_9HYPH|nr:hypothetical protein [Methylobacterium terricola]TNC05121.1 hypothetical protein FF100_36150 [Methylobacterium terricola]
MPSLNLRNVLRRDSNRPTFRKRAAILKAAAARVIHGVPSPLGATNPVLSALEVEFKDAIAELTKADDAIGRAYEAQDEPLMPAALLPKRIDL